MNKRKKIIKGLEAIVNDDWMWRKADYYAGICKDALDLLKAQEPRVMTLEEVLATEVVYPLISEYGKYWRCWTSRPTDEQREATPWN